MWICLTAKHDVHLACGKGTHFALVLDRTGVAVPGGSRDNVASSSEDLANRLRPGVSNSTKVSATRTNFQEELMRLINPDISLAELEHALNQVRQVSSQ